MKTRIENWATTINHSDERFLENTLEQALIDAGFTILQTTKHQFQPYGYTCLWLLGESHCSLHTFPENNSSYIELSSCIENKGDKFWSIICKELKMEREQVKRVIE